MIFEYHGVEWLKLPKVQNSMTPASGMAIGLVIISIRIFILTFNFFANSLLVKVYLIVYDFSTDVAGTKSIHTY